MRAAALLGVVERGDDEPDWRGDVEIKTVPVAREASGLWRVVEDPAIAMVGEGGALAKLQRTLWLARADVDGGDATIVSLVPARVGRRRRAARAALPPRAAEGPARAPTSAGSTCTSGSSRTRACSRR